VLLHVVVVCGNVVIDDGSFIVIHVGGGG